MIKGSNTVTTLVSGGASPDIGNWSADEHLKWFGTVRGRLGWVPTQNLLVYGTGGFAYGRAEHTGNFTLIPKAGGLTGFGSEVNGISFACGVAPGDANPCFAGSSHNTVGWSAGGGLEAAFAPNWSLKGEYLFVSLNNKTLTETAQVVLNPGDVPASFSANFGRTSFNIFRVGLNYQFH